MLQAAQPVNDLNGLGDDIVTIALTAIPSGTKISLMIDWTDC